MTYQNTLDYLFAHLPMYHRVGAQAYKANLDNTVALCKMLGNPQESFRTVHVAGTNGKGSVSHMLASILQAAGYKTGLYTSPHLKDFRERIRVNGKMITKQAVTRFMDRYREESEAIKPSFFELTVGMAFDYFRQQQVEIAVIEVGLGGRLDSTNIITPVVSVITNISFDHMQLLGNSLREIAAEKAGIIKPGVPVVVGETQEEVATVFSEKAAGCFSEILFADRRYRAEIQPQEHSSVGNFIILDVYRDNALFAGHLESPLTGLYQRKNIVTVMAACDILNNSGYNLSLPVLRNGIRNVVVSTGLSGRWQILSLEPLTICDTGHNESGLREVLAQIALTLHKELHIVFGVVNDKHLAPILRLLPKNAAYYFCKPDIPRGLEAGELRQQALAEGLRGDCFSSVAKAMEVAREHAAAGDLVFVGGSTFVVAEVV